MSKLTDKLYDQLGIINALQFAKRGDSAAWISYDINHPHAHGYTSYRATVYFTKADGKEYMKEFRERGNTPAETRKLCIEAAQAYASRRFGITEWVKTPYPNSWVPREAHDRIAAMLKNPPERIPT